MIPNFFYNVRLLEHPILRTDRSYSSEEDHILQPTCSNTSYKLLKPITTISISMSLQSGNHRQGPEQQCLTLPSTQCSGLLERPFNKQLIRPPPRTSAETGDCLNKTVETLCRLVDAGCRAADDHLVVLPVLLLVWTRTSLLMWRTGATKMLPRRR